MKSLFRYIATIYQGRLNRVRFTNQSFLVGVITTLLAFIFIGLLSIMPATTLGIVGIVILSIVILAIYVLSFWLITGLAVKRSHDMNLGGWFAILYFFPISNLIFFFKSGVPKTNQYGEPGAPNSTFATVCAIIIWCLMVLSVVFTIFYFTFFIGFISMALMKVH